MSRKIVHVDMDAFYASVEQLDHPEYRGKPVIVGADPRKGRGRGVVAAASYEARKFGIHSAQPISQAYRLCPQGIFVRVRGERYAEISRRIMDIFYQYTPKVEPISLDEAFLDLTGTERLWGQADDAARRIKQQIRNRLNLTASVGIGPNKLIAKIASDLDKPDGFISVPDSQVLSFLENLPAKSLWGVGAQTQKQLSVLGVSAIGDLRRIGEEALTAQFGNMGGLLWRQARGMDENPVLSRSDIKSISNEVTFNEDVDSPEILRQTLFALCEKVGFRLRGKKLLGRTVHLKIRFENFDTRIRSHTLEEATSLDQEIFEAILLLFQAFDLEGKKVRLLGAGVSRFVDSLNRQTALFPSGSEKADRVQDAMDLLKQRFGRRIVKRGGAMCSRKNSNDQECSPHAF